MRKKFEELTFTDDFMFCKVLEVNPDLCKELAELVTGRRILEIIKPESQKAIKVRPDRKGIRFDVYFEDGEGVAYDIEMQNKSERDLGRRMRYYGGIRDVDLLRSGGKYKNLEDSYIVFICTYNPFSKGLHKYTFETRCVEDTGLVLEDGLHKIMLCSEGRADDVSNSMKEFLAFVGGAEPNSDFTRRIEEEITNVKSNAEWGREYMSLQEIIDEEREEAREEGRQEGREEGRQEGREEGRTEGRAIGEQNAKILDIIKVMEKLKYTVDQAMDFLDIPYDQRATYSGMVMSRSYGEGSDVLG